MFRSNIWKGAKLSRLNEKIWQHRGWNGDNDECALRFTVKVGYIAIICEHTSANSTRPNNGLIDRDRDIHRRQVISPWELYFLTLFIDGVVSLFKLVGLLIHLFLLKWTDEQVVRLVVNNVPIHYSYNATQSFKSLRSEWYCYCHESPWGIKLTSPLCL